MDFKAYLEEKGAMVNETLRSIIPGIEGPASKVLDAMRYSLFAGGKRLRPILCIAGAEAVGGNASVVLPVACALEFIHTYSLIHDDLPVMDDDDLRRGKPTNHKVFGEALALLAGDALLTEAFFCMSAPDISGKVEPALLLRVIRMIASAAGHRGMVGGQVVDIQSEGKIIDFPLVDYIHAHKTGSLIAASVASGAVLGGGSENQIEAASSYGRKVGLAFHIADDILDIEGDSKEIGKEVGSDVRKEKLTYPSVLGLDKSKEIQRQLINGAIECLESFDHRADPLRALAFFIIERRK